MISSFITYHIEQKFGLCILIFKSSLETNKETGTWLWYKNEICFLLVQSSLAYKLSTTSSNNETADGLGLFRTRFSLKSFVSFAAPRGPIDTKNCKGKLTSVNEVRRVPDPCWLTSDTYWYVAVKMTLFSVGKEFLNGYKCIFMTGGVYLPPKFMFSNLCTVFSE